MKIILHIIIFCLPATLLAQKNGFNHNIEMGVSYTFRPANKLVSKPISPFWGLSFNRHKIYKYPSLRVRYLLTKNITDRLESGLETGVTMRYLEPVGDGNITYYSFPLAVNSAYRLLKLSKDRKLFASLHLGYHFKHPKHKLLDGMGGVIGSADFGIKNATGTVSYKLGYEMQQDRRIFEGKDPLSTVVIIRQTRFNQYVSQVFFSAVIKINH